MSVRARYKILRQAKARLVKAMEAALWRRKDWEDSGPDPADSSGRRRLWRWQGAPPAGGKVPRPRTQIRKPGTGRGARTTQETTPMSEQSQNTPIRGQQRTVQMGGFRGPMSRETLMPAGVSKADAWRRTDDPEAPGTANRGIAEQIRRLEQAARSPDTTRAQLHAALDDLGLDKLTVSSLRDLAREVGAEMSGKKTKQDFIRSLRRVVIERKDSLDSLLI